MDRLEVNNLAIIDSLSLDLGRGFHAFSGETGAGKSILVDAIQLLLGGRGAAELLRAGADTLLVTAFWGEQTLSRRITQQGRSTARSDGEVVTLRELGEVAASRITVHGQHAAQALLNPNRQREYLDQALARAQASASNPPVNPLAQYRTAYSAHSQAQERLRVLRQSERDRARRLDILAFELREIEQAAPKIGEEVVLLVERERLGHAEHISEACQRSLGALEDGEINGVTLLKESLRALAQAGKYEPEAAQLAQDLREALASVQAVVAETRNLVERAEADPARLDELEGRLAILEKLKHKYGPELEDVLAYGEKLRAERRALATTEADIADLEQQLLHLTRDLQAQAVTLGAARLGAAQDLAPRLEVLVRELGMPKARLEFALTPLAAPGPHGQELVELVFSANPGQPLASLAKIASGGELSRVMLALSSVLGSETPTVVFDEVDAGIGGAAALAVASQLALLAKKHQVLVVTHLAQIAARADVHFRVQKIEENGHTKVILERLKGEQRLIELARMLSGSDTKAAIAHARELLG
jgi:DNA repair protein RecN (Recombination protein N)